jgi:hypothetical protein
MDKRLNPITNGTTPEEGIGGKVNTVDTATILGYNPEIELTYDGSGNVSVITETFNGVELSTTLEYDGSGNLVKVNPQVIV